jgi:hypothetical protein
MATRNKNPFIPSFLKAALSDSRPLTLTFRDIIDTNITSTSSFKYDTLDSPLKNTQQLNVDWEKFENHTFFSSAEVKVNIAFDQLINGYPFDGSKAEVERFFEKIGGFENWVFNQFPKFGGQLHFSGTRVGENPSNGFPEALGTHIVVKDVAGWLYPDISKNQSGQSYLNPPPNSSFTIESQVFLPDQANDRQVILQKSSSDRLQAYTLHIEPSLTSENEVTGSFSIISGTVQNSVSALLKKGSFNHVCVSMNREAGRNILQFYVDEKLAGESRREKQIEAFNDKSDLYIGSGSSFYSNGTLLTPTQTFSGTLDEFRVFHTNRSINQQKLYASKGLYASDDLKLYFRFNEPSSSLSPEPSDSVNSIVLDSSGNSLHALVANFDKSLRRSTTEDPLSPMINERPEFKVILFPAHPDVISLNQRLLTSASLYDDANPNIITKLIPRHYLREGAELEGKSRTKLGGTITDDYSGKGIPGQGVVGSTQVMLTFLYIWSKFFDEIKMYVDAFKTLRTVNYNLEESVPDNFLNDFIRAYGMYLPPFFNSSNFNQYSDGEDINGINVNDVSLKYVQSQILRRVLVNMPDVLRSKGTQHSIKSFLRSVGIDPDNSMRIREFGGPSKRQLGTCREFRSEVLGFADFHSSSIVRTPFLTASRVEPGYPNAVGPFVNGISTYPSDRLLTSGSWTLEGLYKFSPKNNLRNPEKINSLARLEVTGSAITAQPGLVFNLVSSGSLFAFLRPGMGSTSPLLKMSLPVDVTDGNKWYVSFGCERNDSISSAVSSSYFLRAGTQNAGEITEFYATSSYFKEQFASEGNAFRLLDTNNNASGSRISIGNDPNIPEGTVGYNFLNNTIDVEELARAYRFTGQVSNLRFWSKAINELEAREHTRNHKSVGVDDASTNYNYVTAKSGSFEKLRLSIVEKQETRTSDTAGKILFNDVSENGFSSVGESFPASTNVYYGDIVGYSTISPYFDEYSTSEKVRIRGLLNEELLKDSPNSILGPAYEIAPDETPQDDPRLSIEFSLVDTLNRDIVTIFSNLNLMGNAIGSPELMFSPDYPGLETLRDVYFNRVKEKISFRNFFEFYKWFDTSVGTFIQQLVPRKTKFKGTNFVIESHMLERHKIEYHSSEIYLGDSNRSRIRDNLLVQQISGKISKF